MRPITVSYLVAAFLSHNIWFSRFIPDKPYLKLIYKGYVGKRLNLDNPITYNEKLQWLKLYDRKPLYTQMVDKYEAKKYVATIIGDKYIIPTYGIWENFDEIDFDKLPNQFVLKTTHDSGGIVIVEDKNKFDIEKARKKINKSLSHKFFYINREWPYKNVKPRIIAEKFMENEETKDLKDYKWFCFGGTPHYLFIASDRQNPNEETKFDFYDMDFVHLPITNEHPNSEDGGTSPKSFDLMKKLASKLSTGLPQARIDFYEVNGQVYFGEITLSHWGGLGRFNPEEWDTTFGNLIELPNL